MHKCAGIPLRLADCGDVLTVGELQRVLRVGRNVAYDLVKRNTIRAITLGHRLLVPRVEVERFLALPVEAPGIH